MKIKFLKKTINIFLGEYIYIFDAVELKTKFTFEQIAEHE